MPRATRVLFSLHGDFMFVTSRDDEDQFLPRLVNDLDAEYVVGLDEEQDMEKEEEEQLAGEDPSDENKDPNEDPMENEDPTEDLMEGEELVPTREGPDGEPIEVEEGPDGEPIEVEEDPIAGSMMDDEGWIEDSLEDSDDESHINWEAELLHIDDVPIDWDASHSILMTYRRSRVCGFMT